MKRLATAGAAVAFSAFISLTTATAASAANTNPIDWRVSSTYFGPHYEDVPLRYGQHDQGAYQGFGINHIRDGHLEVPTHTQIENSIGDIRNCTFQRANETYRCYDGRTIVVFTNRVDSRAPDGRPVGIITAYGYLPCLAAHPETVDPQC